MKRSPYKSKGTIIHELDIIKFTLSGKKEGLKFKGTEEETFKDIVVESNGIWYACSISIMMGQVLFIGGRLLKDCLEKSEIVGSLDKEYHHPLLPDYDKYMEIIKEIKNHVLVSTAFN